MRFALISVLALLCALGTASAADVTGAWAGKVSTPNGEFDLKFTFQQDGQKLSGTALGPQGEPMPIMEGKVDGDNISFSIEVQMNGGMKIPHTGKVSGDTMDLQMKFGDQPPMSVKLSRAKG